MCSIENKEDLCKQDILLNFMYLLGVVGIPTDSQNHTQQLLVLII